MARYPRLLGLMFAAGVSVGAACTDVGMGAETSTTDGTSGECPVGQVGCRCTSGGACNPGLLCASMYCVEPDDGTSTTDDATTTEDPTTTSATTGEPECNVNGNGGTDPACSVPDKPYCVLGECVGCASISCEQVSPSQPMCDPETGKCAACLCDDAAPVCDPVAHSCGPCTTHDDCPDSACNLWTGACMAAVDTLWVDKTGGCSDDATGEPDAPLCTLNAAFLRIGAEGAGGYAVRAFPATYMVNNPLRATADHVVALVQAGGGASAGVEIVAADSPAIAIDADGALLVDGVRLSNGGSDGLSCSSGEAWLDRLIVQGSTGRGLSADNCAIKLRRGLLVANTIAGAELRGGSLRVENSFISSNGNTQNGGGGVYLALGATIDAVYTTWIANLGQAGTPFAVACDEDAEKETVVVRNSVAINKGLNTLCDGAVVKNSAWSNDPPGTGNISVDFDMLALFLTADPQLTGVYRAIAGTTIDELAMWQTGDPAIDFDGDERPSGDNSPDFAGADRVAR